MKSVSVASVEEFLRELYVMRRDHVVEFRGQASSMTFYRGHANVEWSLEPRLYREQLHLEEQNLIADARTLVPHLFTDAADFQSLAMMQHFGLPTRLLDVTTNPLVALYFACLGPDDVDGQVYVFPNLVTFREDSHQVQVNMEFVFRHTWENLHLEEFERLARRHLPRDPLDSARTITSAARVLTGGYTAVLATHANPRLAAQSGAFLLFGMEETSRVVSTDPGTRGNTYISFSPPDPVDFAGIPLPGGEEFEGLSLLVPGGSKDRIRRQLDHIDVNVWRLFPEAGHAMQYIYESYRSGRRHGFRGWEVQDI